MELVEHIYNDYIKKGITPPKEKCAIGRIDKSAKQVQDKIRYIIDKNILH